MSLMPSRYMQHQSPLVFDDIADEASFLALAGQFGEPTKLGGGGYIKTLRIKDQADAAKNTLSGIYGTGSFPFHSDGAFMLKPPRWVLLRALNGDLNRSTYVQSFLSIVDGIDEKSLRSSIWMCDNGVGKFYTTIRFSGGNVVGYRYDENCMSAVNQSAKEIERMLLSRTQLLDGHSEVKWAPNKVLVIPNWTYLHARGPSSELDADRVLQRIYIT